MPSGRERWVGTAWEDAGSIGRVLGIENADRTRQVVDGLRLIAQEAGATTAQVAIAWLLRQPGVASAIAGSGNPDRTRESAQAGNVDLSDEQLKAVEDLIPLGPSFA